MNWVPMHETFVWSSLPSNYRVVYPSWLLVSPFEIDVIIECLYLGKETVYANVVFKLESLHGFKRVLWKDFTMNVNQTHYSSL